LKSEKIKEMMERYPKVLECVEIRRKIKKLEELIPPKE
jgi:hypothetical protein